MSIGLLDTYPKSSMLILTSRTQAATHRGTHMDKVSQILAETARDLTLAHVAGKPLDRIVSEGAARIAAHFQPRLCKTPGCKNEAHPYDWCRECDDRQFSHGEGE